MQNTWTANCKTLELSWPAFCRSCLEELLLWPVFYLNNLAIELPTYKYEWWVSDTLNDIIKSSNIKSECEVFLACWSLNEPLKWHSTSKIPFLIVWTVWIIFLVTHLNWWTRKIWSLQPSHLKMAWKLYSCEILLQGLH